jgi:dCMP deaminase
MNLKHIQHRLRQVKELMKLSSCVKRGVGAVAVDENNIVLSEAYNGWIRGSESSVCGSPCSRLEIQSGTKMEIGCVHAEQNLIVNAARTNTSLVNSIVFLSTYPCLVCAKLLVQAGVKRVFVLENSYPDYTGVNVLKQNGIIVIETEVS